MDPRTFLDTAAPTPFGWVITTQGDFDLNTILSFRSQLASLSRFFESQKPVAPAMIEAGTGIVDGVDEEALQPMPLKAA